MSDLTASSSGINLTRSSSPVPSYPMLRADVPLLRRTPNDLQIGLDAGALIVEAAPAGLSRVLALLDGTHHLSEIQRRAELSGITSATLDALLDRLVTAGLVVSSPLQTAQGRTATGRHRPAAGPATRVALVGAGAVGRALARLLADPTLQSPSAGRRLDELVLVDGTPADQTGESGESGSATRAEALETEIRTELAARPWSGQRPPRVVVRTGVLGDRGERPNLVIVCPETLEADRLVLDELVRLDLPHLPVRVAPAGAVVGPLVLPGRTACVRCSDLVRRDADQAWPHLLAQLCRLRARPSAGSLGWAVGVAGAQILGFLADEAGATAGLTSELSGVDFTTGERIWGPHRECGCRWLHVDLAQ